MANAIRQFVLTGDTQDLLLAYYPLTESLVAATPYIFAGLSVALGFKCGLLSS